MTISGGAGTAVAALASVAVVTNETTASARHADVQVGVAEGWKRVVGVAADDASNNEGAGAASSSGPAGGKLKIEANDHGLINQLSGAAGISFGAGGAVGGTVSILVAKSNVTADVRSSLVDAKDVTIHALNSQDQLAGTVGVGGAADGRGLCHFSDHDRHRFGQCRPVRQHPEPRRREQGQHRQRCLRQRRRCKGHAADEPHRQRRQQRPPGRDRRDAELERPPGDHGAKQA